MERSDLPIPETGIIATHVVVAGDVENDCAAFGRSTSPAGGSRGRDASAGER